MDSLWMEKSAVVFSILYDPFLTELQAQNMPIITP